MDYASATIDDLRGRATELRGDLAALPIGTRSDEQAVTMAHLLDEVNLLDRHMTLANLALVRQDRPLIGAGPLAGTREVATGPQRPSLGSGMLSDEAFCEWVSKGARDRSPVVQIDSGLWGLRDDTNMGASGIRANVLEFGSGGPSAINATGAINTLLPVGQPIAPIPRFARLYMRDLIPTQPTTYSQIPYVRELAPTTTEVSGAAVAEGNVKPDQTLQFSGQSAPVTVIAGNLTMSKQIFADAPGIVTYVNGRLPYIVKYAEDAMILGGNGTWPNFTGILNTSGIQSQGATAGDYAVTLGNAIAKVESVDGSATGVVMNPIDAWVMFLKRAASGGGQFDAGNPFSMAMGDALTVWGMPVKRTRAKPQGSAIVGDWQMGAALFDREIVNVQVYPQNEDYAKRNLVLVQAEERLAVAWFRPDLFVNATL